MSNNNIIKSFFSKDNLNSQVWQDEDTLNPDVRAKLLEIATEFIDFLSVPILVEDIIFTGSLANFNWSEFSDIDLHIVANFAQFDEDLLELYQELFKVKKTIFNSDFTFKILQRFISQQVYILFFLMSGLKNPLKRIRKLTLKF